MNAQNNFLVNLKVDVTMLVTATDEDGAKAIAQTIMLACPNNSKIDKVEVVVTNAEFAICDIMTPNPRHDSHLIGYINYAYGKHTAMFNDILTLLITRDKKELYHIGLNIKSPREELMKEYLMEIATDDDLRTILQYCKVEY